MKKKLTLYALMVFLCMSLFLSCNNTNEPITEPAINLFDNHYLFIEFEEHLDSKDSVKEGDGIVPYIFNENNFTLKINTELMDLFYRLGNMGSFNLNDSNKFVIGHKFWNFSSGYYKSGMLYTSIDWLTDRNIDIEITQTGEVKILFDDDEYYSPNEVFLKPGESAEIKVIYINAVVATIRNHGFIKKENVTYY